jgi:predicted TIM-barrel fold metal-dependent hydrolase
MPEIVFFDTNITLGKFPALPIQYDIDFETARQRLGSCGITSGLMQHRQSWENEPDFGHMLLEKELTGKTGFRPIWNMLPLHYGTKRTLAETISAMSCAKVAGVVLHPGLNSFIVDEWCAGSLFSLLEEIRMPLFIEMNAGDIAFRELETILRCHPGLPVIIRNTSYQVDFMIYPLLEMYNNVYIETCGYKTLDGISTLCREFGAKRLIFGSNYPYESPGGAVTQLLLSGLPPEDISKIASENMLELIDAIKY